MTTHLPPFGKRTGKSILFSLLFLLALPFAEGVAAQKIPIGGRAPDFTIRDRWFLSRSLSELKYRAVVLVIMDPTCPLVKRLIPLINDLQMRVWREHQNVLVIGAFVDPRETPQSIQEYALLNQVSFPVVKLAGDTDLGLGGTLAELGLSRLSSSLLLGENKEILYRGRFSDKVRLTGFVEGGRDHLSEALNAYLAGQPISPVEVEAEGCLIETDPPAATVQPVTWKEVAPVLSKHCISCHRPGGGAPFSLNTFEAASRKARTIVRVTSDGQMPPWYASPVSVFPFSNENRLDDGEKKILADWVKSGTPGPSSDPLEPAIQSFPTPDATYLSPEIKVPATGKIPYVNVLLPLSVSTQDRWVSAIRIVPTNPKVVHHANLGFVRAADFLSGSVSYENFITGYVPGVSPMILEPGVGLKIPANSFLGLQVHIVTTGVEEATQIRVEVKCIDKVSRRLRFHYFNTADLSIPPEAPHYEVKEEWVTPDDIELVGAFAHMHYRGHDFHLTVREGTKISTLLAIPNYQYDWQMGYQWPIGKISKGTGSRFTVVSHFDNSKFNVFNPNPESQVSYGEQSDDEMMLGFLFYLLKTEDLSRDK